MNPLDKQLQTESRRLERIKTLLIYFAELCEFLRDSAQAALVTIQEYERLRDSIRTHNRPLDFEQFRAEVMKRDDELAQLLAGCKVRKFDMGRLILERPDGHDGFMVDIRKETIQKMLGEVYSTPFRLYLKKPASA